MDEMSQITEILLKWSQGNKAALEELIPLVYDNLHKIAQRYLKHENPNHTIQTTALVNEAYLKLVEQKYVQWQNRQHFFAIAAKIMRRILINYARDKKAEKRGGARYKVSLSEDLKAYEPPNIDLLLLDQDLTKLAEIDARKIDIIELRFFTGISLEEVAETLGISLATAKRDWRMAKAWLYREIMQSEPKGDLDEPA
ncbi:MAG: sigma-70 family RNA polymerase sigma factor [Blastocatellia bacterium]|nr:sigma-70 family RNA polymerase sigma factor [Blastocatellia bacterium]